MKDYKHTMFASYIGYITQAIVNNFVPLLFLTLQHTYQISLSKITLLVTINFGVQLMVDSLSAHFIDKIGYKISIVGAHLFAAVGLAGLGIFPELFSDPYSGLLLAICLYAVGGGLIEVLISPIVEACPTDKKSAAMSLLHSFYCWGHMFVVIGSTLFFNLFGIENWKVLALLWASIPFLNALYFTRVPIATLNEAGDSMSIRQLFSMKLFWILAILMVCAGASEQAMSQWSSAFAESSLKISKTFGDLVGPCLFAAFMGIARVFYSKFSERVNLQNFMIGSGVLCIISYLLAALSPYPMLALIGCGLCGLSVGVLWPGTFSLAAEKCPRGGTAMFALFALAGDLGCSAGPTVVGMVSTTMKGSIKSGLLVAIIFPALLIIGLVLCRRMSKPINEGINISE